MNEVSIDDYEAAMAEKKAAIAAMMKKGDTAAKVVDDSAFASMTLAAKSDEAFIVPWGCDALW